MDTPDIADAGLEEGAMESKPSSRTATATANELAAAAEAAAAIATVACGAAVDFATRDLVRPADSNVSCNN